MTNEDELRVKLMIAEARIVSLERELALYIKRQPIPPLEKLTPRKIREKATLSARYIYLMNLTDGTCFYCSCDLDVATLTADHLVPISKGGGNGMRNLVPACQECNNKKGNRMPCTQEVEKAVYLHRTTRKPRLSKIIVMPPGSKKVNAMLEQYHKDRDARAVEKYKEVCKRLG